ncbi:MAG TPA: TA system VapC family ribonuclease toxin [Acidobacteriaceae bacterium]|jgi:hypothetical protein|nr:TA system VapC family ribonuclease toxin [Acidobacteriaceae bacterium]
MSGFEPSWLLDVNVLVALIDEQHGFHRRAAQWRAAASSAEPSAAWSLAPFTEAGFVRVVTNPRYPNPFSVAEALEVLALLAAQKGYAFCAVTESLTTLAQPFVERLFGHQQITDACLLGLAIRGGRVLVTFDKGLRTLAGPAHARHVHVLE